MLNAETVAEIDAAIEAWTLTKTLEEVLSVLDAAKVPAGKVYTVEDIVHDPQYIAREMIVEQQTADGARIKVPGIVPKLSATPGQIRHPAPLLGEHTAAISKMVGWPERNAVEVQHA